MACIHAMTKGPLDAAPDYTNAALLATGFALDRPIVWRVRHRAD